MTLSCSWRTNRKQADIGQTDLIAKIVMKLSIETSIYNRNSLLVQFYFYFIPKETKTEWNNGPRRILKRVKLLSGNWDLRHQNRKRKHKLQLLV